jgi:hypothetical protein
MRTQYQMKWLEYEVIHSSFERDQFVIDVLIVFNNSIKTHFVFEFVGKQ